MNVSNTATNVAKHKDFARAGRAGAEKPGHAREWLSTNRSLRMDANLDMFDSVRRDFHLERYHYAKQHCAGKRVLDAACGTGYGSGIMAETAKHVSGVDISQEAVDYCRATYGKSNAEFYQGCAELLPFEDDSFDLTVSFETLEHTIAPRATMMEFARVLHPAGTAIFSIPNEWGYTKNHFHDFDLPMLEEIVDEFYGKRLLLYQNSGDGPEFGGKKGIGPLEEIQPKQAECILAVCQQPKKENLNRNRTGFLLTEIYKNAFARHHEFLHLHRRRFGPFTSIIRRLFGAKSSKKSA